MTRVPQSGAVKFELRKTFSETGDYSYAYLVRESPFSPYLARLMNKGEIVSSLMIPAIQDDYSSNVQYKGQDGNGSYEQWGFYMYQCTSWVALKVNQMWGTGSAFNNRMFGSALSYAAKWKQRFLDNNYSVDRNPKAGDIIWFPANAFNSKGKRFSYGMGHVGFVHSVNGSQISYTEYNGGDPNSYRNQKYRLDELLSATSFIHVQQQR